MACNNPELHFNSAGELYKQGRLEDAVVELREALRLRPELPEAHYNLGNVLSDLRRYDEAERAYREALRLRPDYPEAHNGLGILLKELKRYDETEREYREALRLRPNYPEALKAYERAREEYLQSLEKIKPCPSFQRAWKGFYLFICAVPMIIFLPWYDIVIIVWCCISVASIIHAILKGCN